MATEEPLLRYAATDIAAPEPQSYIVAFRRLVDHNEEHFTAFPQRLRSQTQALLRNFSLDLGKRIPRYLSSLNLSDLSHSFIPRAKNFGPELLTSDPQSAVADSMASLVEVEFPNELSARTTLRKWLSEGRIYFAEPNGRSALKSEVEDAIIDRFQDNAQATPWLDQVSFLPALQQISAQIDAGKPIGAPVVAVMDSGVDVMHPNIFPAIYDNSQGQNKLCKDDLYGCNTTVARKEDLGDGEVWPAGTSGFGQYCAGQGECEHGTHVAGIIAARNADRYVGLCPYCQILVVKVVDLELGANNKTSFQIKDASIIAGLAYISGFKSNNEPLVRVINASFGKFEKSRSVELFIKSLKNFGRGTLMVAAAGNEDTMKRQYPAGFDSVIAVSNVESDVKNPRKSPSSNFGTWVDISAPGDGVCDGGGGIRSSTPGGGQGCKVGTSMASPMVAGIAGLMFAKDNSLTAAEVERRLLSTAEPDNLYLNGVNNGYKPDIKGLGIAPMLGTGVVNANLALDPSLDQSPPVTTERNDLVSAGCGVVGFGSGAAASGWLFLLPLLGIMFRKRLRS